MNILDSGINLMLYGMGTVFVFLTVLIITTMTMSSLIAKFFGSEEPISATLPETTVQSVSGRSLDPRLLKVLQAAVDAHKN